MTKIEQIESAVNKSINRVSKLTPLALSTPMLGSLNIRHLLNNLAEISTSFMEVGSHVGGSFVSATFGNHNLRTCIAIDSWASDQTEGHNFEEQFKDNVYPVVPGAPITIIKSDSFEVNLQRIVDSFPASQKNGKIDFYYFDGSHDYESQKKALLYYLPVLDDEFIFAVDDYMLFDVSRGTQDAIHESGCTILYENEFVTDHEYDNESFWRGWYIALLKKKS